MRSTKIFIIFALSLATANATFLEKKLFLINKLKHKLGHKLGLGGGHHHHIGIDTGNVDCSYYGTCNSGPDRPYGTGPGGCVTVFETEWSTQYQEVEEEECSEAAPACRTEYTNICSPVTRQQCQTSQDTQCVTVYREVCNEVIDIVNVKSASCDPTAQGIDESTGCQYKWEGKGE